MEREVAVRRFVHALVALAPVYYLIPIDLPYVHLPRWVLLVVFISAMFAFESVRVWKKYTFLGLRPHEKYQLASHAWAAAGLFIVLWLFPHDIATVAIVGWALVDPLMGMLRSKKLSRRVVIGVSAGTYFILGVAMLLLWNERSSVELVLLAMVGTALAIPAEYFKVRYIDDDFLMDVLPAFAMMAIAVLLFSQQV